MKILLTGGGSGGHFYPIIAVAEALYELSEEERVITPELILMSDKKFDSKLIQKEGLVFKKVYAGKIRRYFSLLNITDFFKTIVGILKALFSVYSDMPNVVFGKGGYVSFPALLAARIFRIPVIIHETDSIPGKVNKWAGRFAKRIAISFPETAEYFNKEKTALTGTPVVKSKIGQTFDEGKEIFNIEPDIPTLLVLGGSQGAIKINDVLLSLAPELVKSFQIIHQCGKDNEKDTRGRLEIVLENSIFKNRYHLYPYLDDDLLRNASSVADIIISRAGGTAIYEIAAWEKPSILIPLKNSAQDHQRENAYSFSKEGAAAVLEEENLSPHVLLSEIKRILENDAKKKKMSESAKNFAKPDAARKIAKEILNLALKYSTK